MQIWLSAWKELHRERIKLTRVDRVRVLGAVLVWAILALLYPHPVMIPIAGVFIVGTIIGGRALDRYIKRRFPILTTATVNPADPELLALLPNRNDKIRAAVCSGGFTILFFVYPTTAVVVGYLLTLPAFIVLGRRWDRRNL